MGSGFLRFYKTLEEIYESINHRFDIDGDSRKSYVLVFSFLRRCTMYKLSQFLVVIIMTVVSNFVQNDQVLSRTKLKIPVNEKIIPDVRLHQQQEVVPPSAQRKAL